MIGLRLDQVDFYLNRCVGQAAQDLGFGHDLERHQVEQRNAQRADVLRCCTVLGHHKYVFAFQNRTRGQTVGYFYRQASDLLYTIGSDRKIIAEKRRKDKGGKENRSKRERKVLTKVRGI